jgi:hypothetical protein
LPMNICALQYIVFAPQQWGNFPPTGIKQVAEGCGVS